MTTKSNWKFLKKKIVYSFLLRFIFNFRCFFHHLTHFLTQWPPLKWRGKISTRQNGDENAQSARKLASKKSCVHHRSDNPNRVWQAWESSNLHKTDYESFGRSAQWATTGEFRRVNLFLVVVCYNFLLFTFTFPTVSIYNSDSFLLWLVLIMTHTNQYINLHITLVTVASLC